MPPTPTISIVDDDESVRESLLGLLRSVGFTVTTFSSADEYLRAHVELHDDCLVLDVRMPGTSGPELQRILLETGARSPIVFMSAQSDEDVRASVLERGAVDFLSKPFAEAELLDAITRALASNREES